MHKTKAHNSKKKSNSFFVQSLLDEMVRVSLDVFVIARMECFKLTTLSPEQIQLRLQTLASLSAYVEAAMEVSNNGTSPNTTPSSKPSSQKNVAIFGNVPSEIVGDLSAWDPTIGS